MSSAFDSERLAAKAADISTDLSSRVFLFGTLALMVLYPVLSYLGENFYANFRNITPEHKKYYVVSNSIKALALAVILAVTGQRYWHETIQTNIWSVELMMIISACYAITDTASIFMVPKMQKNTIIHHWCVVFAHWALYFFGDWSSDGVCRWIAHYCVLSMSAWTVNLYLAMRVVEPHAAVTRMTRTLAFWIYVVSVSINWSYQAFKVGGSLLRSIEPSVLMYALFLALIVNDDIVLLKFLGKGVLGSEQKGGGFGAAGGGDAAQATAAARPRKSNLKEQ